MYHTVKQSELKLVRKFSDIVFWPGHMFDQKAENLNVPEDVEMAGDTKCRYTIEEQVFIKLNNVFIKEFELGVVRAKKLEELCNVVSSRHRESRGRSRQ